MAEPAPPTPAEGRLTVLIPVKAFDQAKVRLAPSLDAPSRARLAQRMATTVVLAAAPLPVWIVCDSEPVAAWAADVGASVSWQPGRGLNEAVTSAVAERAAAGCRRVIVAHGDLPLARSLGWLADGAADDAAIVVPDRHGDGTNVLCLPADAGFRFAYGPGSFARHLAEAARLRLAVRVERDASLGWDVDLPADLAAVADL